MSCNSEDVASRTEQPAIMRKEETEERGTESSAKHIIRTCLHRLLRVTLADGRIVEGTLECYDNLANMVLSNATDISSKGTRPFGRTIRLGMVLIPGAEAKKVLAWRQKYADTGAVVESVPVATGLPNSEPIVVGEDSDDELVIAEGFDSMHFPG